MKRNQEEHKIQCAIIEWARMPANIRRWPSLALLHAIPNGGARDARTGAMLKREGVLRGVWDLFLPSPLMSKTTDGVHIVLITAVQFCGLYLEVKTPRGRLTHEQGFFGDRVRMGHYATYIVRSAQSGINAITAYLEGRFEDGKQY